MLEDTAAIELNEQSPLKCGEIFLKSFSDLTIYCSFCDSKLLSLEEFLFHLQNKHFEHKSSNAVDILREYDKNILLDENKLLDEQLLESYISAEELEEESGNGDSYQKNFDEEESLYSNFDEEKDSNKMMYCWSEEESVSIDFDEEKDFDEDNQDFDDNKYNENEDHHSNDMDYALSNDIEVSNKQKDIKIEINQIAKVFDWDDKTDEESSENEDFINLVNSKENSSKNPQSKATKSLKKSVGYSCPECQQTFKLMMLLDDHIVDNHGGLKCTICNKRFGKRQHLTRHKSTHNTEKIYACTIEGCGKTFAVLDYYQHHMRKHRDGGSARPKNTRYVCDQCGLTCTTSFSLNVHMRLHTGEKPFKCEFCEKSYISKSSLRNHMVSHNTIRNFICNICQAAFKTNRALKKHHYVHMDERNFKCELCPAAFKQPHGLLQHIQYVHKGKKDTRIRRRKNKKSV